MRENLLQVYARYVAGTESPDSFHIWSVITAVGYLMGRKTWLQPGNRESVQYPRLYTVLVAPPGAARKSQALNTAVRFIRDLGLPVVPDSITREALIEFAAENEVEDEIPLNDEETLLVKRNDVFLASSEFSVFLREKRVNNGTIMLLNHWYDCPKDSVERTIGRGTTPVAGVFMPILAATTAPALAQSLTQADIEGGIASRILFVVETKSKGRLPFRTPTPEQLAAEKEIAQRFKEIQEFYRGEMNFSPEAYEFYKTWYVGERYDKGVSHPRLEYYVSRKQNHFFATAMICQAIIEPSMTVSLDAAKLAVDLLESIEPNMPLAFAGVGVDEKDPAMRLSTRIISYVARYPKGVTIKELFRAFYTEIRFEDMEAAVEHLVKARQLQRVKSLYKVPKTEAIKVPLGTEVAQ